MSFVFASVCIFVLSSTFIPTQSISWIQNSIHRIPKSNILGMTFNKSANQSKSGFEMPKKLLFHTFSDQIL